MVDRASSLRTVRHGGMSTTRTWAWGSGPPSALEELQVWRAATPCCRSDLPGLRRLQPEQAPARLDLGCSHALLVEIGDGSTAIAAIQPAARCHHAGRESWRSHVHRLRLACDRGPDQRAAAVVQGYPLHRREFRRGTVRLLGTGLMMTTLAASRRGCVGITVRRSTGCCRGRRRGRRSACCAASALDGPARPGCIGPNRVGAGLAGRTIFDRIYRLRPIAGVMVADGGLRDDMLLRMTLDRCLLDRPAEPSPSLAPPRRPSPPVSRHAGPRVAACPS